MKVLCSLILFAGISTTAHADRIGVHNRTPRDLYGALYYIGMKLPWMKEIPKGKLASDIKLIESDSIGYLQRPARKIGYDRELVFVEDQELLTPELTKKQLKDLHSKNVGDLQGDVFYIGDKDGEFYGYTTIEWNVAKPIIESARNAVVSGLPALKENPYKGAVAHVRIGNELSVNEKNYRTVRRFKVKAALETLLGKPIEENKVPIITIVCSGGGYRAMLLTTGALEGARKAGILDATTYMVGLSGSTWAIGGWLNSSKPIQVYRDWLINNVRYGLKNLSSNDMSLMGDFLLTKYFSDEPLDTVDVYGGLLANELFAEFYNTKQRQALSGQARYLKTGELPFPIYTAIAAESISAENLWYEFTPYEVGAAWLAAYVPTWAFGRKFKNGVSVSFAPEQNFGVLLGTFGLAIGITITRLLTEVGIREKIDNIFVKNIIDRIESAAGKKRITSSDFFNFTYGMPQSKIPNQRLLRMVDAGINFKLPYPPISGERAERKADIIIFVDASSDNLGNDLRHAEQYARTRNLKFPNINYTDIDKKAFSVFKDEKDPQAPIVIYIPRTVDKMLFADERFASLAQEFPGLKTFNMASCIDSGPCTTFNFKYSPEAAKKVVDLGELNMRAAREAFIDAIKVKIK